MRETLQKWFGLIPLGIGIAFIVWGVLDFQKKRGILAHGIVTTARIIKKWVDQGNFNVKVRFSDQKGNTMTGKKPLMKFVWDRLSIGSIIPVTFDSKNPGSFTVGAEVRQNPWILLQKALLVGSILILAGLFLLLRLLTIRARAVSS